MTTETKIYLALHILWIPALYILAKALDFLTAHNWI